jgi:uncharacterized membrane protein YbhN (UPF0104 family)
MGKLIDLLILGLQMALTFTVLFCIYMFFALCDNEFGIDGLFGLFIIQPVFSVILSMITIIVCVLIGLPIRLSRKLNCWWTKHFYIAIFGGILGMVVFVFSIFPNFKETVVLDNEITKQIPNTALVSAGWLLTAFSLLHIYPPAQILSKLKSFFHRKHY